jgi:hypothetical protein
MKPLTIGQVARQAGIGVEEIKGDGHLYYEHSARQVRAGRGGPSQLPGAGAGSTAAGLAGVGGPGADAGGAKGVAPVR